MGKALRAIWSLVRACTPAVESDLSWVEGGDEIGHSSGERDFYPCPVCGRSRGREGSHACVSVRGEDQRSYSVRAYFYQ